MAIRYHLDMSCELKVFTQKHLRAWKATAEEVAASLGKKAEDDEDAKKTELLRKEPFLSLSIFLTSGEGDVGMKEVPRLCPDYIY